MKVLPEDLNVTELVT